MKFLVCCAAFLTACLGFADETALQSVGDSICTIDRVEKSGQDSATVDFTLRPEAESEICCRIILPPKSAWNGELWGVGNDSCGGVIPSVKSFLGVGNAVVTTDLGTRRYVKGDRRGKPWPEAVSKDYSWRATHLMTVYGKKLVQAQYGIPPKQSYFCGGSCGGRQGFSEAMRFPADYDGVIATIPGSAIIVQNAQALNLYRQTHDETGRELFTTNQLRILADAPIEYMKDKDVAPYAGSVLSNPFFSEKDIDGMLALAAKKDPSLAAPDLMRRMKGIFLGAKDSQGRTLCHGMMPGAFHGNRRGANFRLKGLALMAVLRDGYRRSAYPSWEEFEQKAVSRGAEINATSTDLSAFARRGGKLIVTCGWEDQSTPAPEIIAWYENLAEDNGGYGKVQEYCRLFPLPGTAHGGGKGRITTGGAAVGRLQHDLLRRWVTKGVAPETFPLKWPAKKLTLPIPPYPLQCYLGTDGQWKTRRYPENMVRHPDRRLYRTNLSIEEGTGGGSPGHAVAASGTNATARVALPDVPKIDLEGEHGGHLQDVWYDGQGHLYWAVTRSIAKTDLTGKILAQSERIDDHQGGIEVRDGRLYAASCMQHKKCGGKTTPECRVTVREYDAETLKPIAAHVTDINDRAGSLAILDDGTYVVGCLRPQDILDTQVRFHHLDRNFKLIKTYVMDNVPALLGIEVIKKKGDYLYLCVYGVGKNRKLDFNCIKLDRAFREVGRGWLTGSVGLVFEGNDVWIGKTEKNKETKKFKNALHRIKFHKSGSLDI